jgi:hypothetical protein
VKFLLLFLAGLAQAAGALPQQVYLWQRAWTEPVRQALVQRGDAFAGVIVLKAEVTWREGKPQLIEVPVDYRTLAGLTNPIGFALRVGPYAGPFNGTNAAAEYLCTLARRIVTEAETARLHVSELQLDFDCASSKLEGYGAWVKAIRERIAPVPLVITTLPAWLDAPAFKSLVQTADGFVLQVHSLERPRSFDAPFTLCDPPAAERATARASEFGVPFRVALPTYGYQVCFDTAGHFVGLSAEGPEKSWPADSRVKEVRSDPLELAQLLLTWSTNSPANLKGIIWYRLPVAGDILNWRWPTLKAMLEMRIPRKSVRVESHRVASRLNNICLVNDGELDISSRLAVNTRWRGARLSAGDGLRGFEMTESEVSSARFVAAGEPYRLHAGEQHVIAWVRLTDDREVQVELEELEGR